jgi:predicted O-methyltransferase YrrM
MSNYSIFYIKNINTINDFKINNNNNKKIKNFIVKFEQNYYESNIKFNSINNIELIEHKAIIIMLYNLFDIIEIGGNIQLHLSNYSSYKSINILYLLLNFFEKIIIIKGNNLYCLNYKMSYITKDDIKKIFDNNIKFSINNKFNINNLIQYLEYNFNILIHRNKLLLDKNENKYLKYMDKYYTDLLIEIGDINIINIKLKLFFINYFKKIFDKNKIVNINSGIKYEEGQYLKKIINNNNYKKCLEIGFANGISAAYILMNNNVNLISIDPFQKTQWKSEGIKMVKRFSLNNRHKLILKKSYEALPELLKKYGENYFEFIFIDGWHTFDYTLVDFFYSNLLLKIGGIIIIDDALHNGVSKCIKYLELNYKFYSKLEGPKTIAIFKKISNDNRDWNYHTFF